MSIDARLNKLMPALSAKERAILVLRTWKEKRPQDPEWRRSMPSDQSREFNRYVTLMNACNLHLPLFITMVEQHSEQMWLRLNWLMTLDQFGSALWHLGALVPAGKHKLAERAVSEVFPIVELPWDREQHERSWLNVSDKMTQDIREGVAHLWDEVNAIDVVLGEVAMELEGEDPLRPVMRGVLEQARRDLKLLHEFFSGKEAIEVTQPSEEALELVRVYFDKGVELYDRL